MFPPAKADCCYNLVTPATTTVTSKMDRLKIISAVLSSKMEPIILANAVMENSKEKAN
jgi:hypothetical protein